MNRGEGNDERTDDYNDNNAALDSEKKVKSSKERDRAAEDISDHNLMSKKLLEDDSIVLNAQEIVEVMKKQELET